jgi:DNA polymerase III gamma/tau subunit
MLHRVPKHHSHADLVLPRTDIGSVASLVAAIAQQDIAACLGLIQKLADDGVVFEQFSQQLLEYLRLAMLVASGMQPNAVAPGYDGETTKALASVARAVPAAKLAAMVDELLQQLRSIKTSPLPQLPLELFCVRAVLSLGSGFSSNDDRPNPPPASPTPPAKSPVIARKAPEAPDVATPLPKDQVSDNEAGEPAAPEKPVPMAEPVPGVPIEIEKLYEVWEQVREAVALQNRSLSAFLKVVKVISLERNVLTLGWRYGFQAERAMNPGCANVLAGALATALGSRIEVSHLVDEAYEGRPWWPHLASQPREATPELEDLSQLVQTLSAQAVEA